MPPDLSVVDPPAEPVSLGSFEGLPVLGVGIEIPNAAGGLRDPLKVDPLILHGGDTAFATFELDTRKIRFDPVYDDDTDELRGWTRVHVLAVANATFIDEELVRDQLDEMAERVAERKEAEQLAKEKAKGVQRIGGADQLAADHADGQHADGLVPGCADCDDEAAAKAAEGRVDGKTAAAGE